MQFFFLKHAINLKGLSAQIQDWNGSCHFLTCSVLVKFPTPVSYFALVFLHSQQNHSRFIMSSLTLHCVSLTQNESDYYYSNYIGKKRRVFVTKQGARSLLLIPRLHLSATSATCFKKLLDVFGISLLRVKLHLSKENFNSELLPETRGEV